MVVKATPPSPVFLKHASYAPADRGTCEDILRRVYDENPSFWPNGNSIGLYDGGVYLIKSASDEVPVGFVGWQVRDRGAKRVGFYGVGVLPEHRAKGYAEAAVRALVHEKAASVDEVRAMIVPGNTPSERLAGKLGVSVEWLHPVDFVKAAGLLSGLKSLVTNAKPVVAGAVKDWKWPTVGAAAYGLGVDSLRQRTEHPGEDFSFSRAVTENLVGNALNFIVNTGLLKHYAGKGDIASAIVAMPTKDLALQAMTHMPSVVGDFRSATDSLKKMTSKDHAIANGAQTVLDAMAKHPLATAGAASALGLGGLAWLRSNMQQSAALNRLAENSEGKVKVTLPTRNPGDAETVVESPISKVDVSNALHGKLNRDFKRHLRFESASRVRHKDKSLDDNQPLSELDL